VNLDIFPTCLAAAGLSLPEDRAIDGRDLRPLLTGRPAQISNRPIFLYHHGELEGIRSGDWKYLRSTSDYAWPMPVNKRLGFLTSHTTGPEPLLFDLRTDPGEAYNLAQRRPGVVERMEGLMKAWEAEMASNPLGFLQ
jgi:arylsulfatase A-like enzyme